MKEIKFKTTTKESALIGIIADRYKKFVNADRMDILMDITACHCNGNPLDLKRLSEADSFNLCHDVGGIRRHIDRETGLLMDCFLPRFTAKVSK